MSAKGGGPSKRYQPNTWTERLIPVILVVLLVILVVTVLFVILTLF
ncbi:MAG: hypothetical protein ACWGO1_11315 [Anaerolineales bacterium]